MLASIVGVENAIKNPTEVTRVNTLLAISFLEWAKIIKLVKLYIPQQVKIMQVLLRTLAIKYQQLKMCLYRYQILPNQGFHMHIKNIS